MMLAAQSRVKILPLVSIGVPIYNGAETLHEALLSLRQQTYENLEIIVSDDCSSDSSREICVRHVSEDIRIKFFKQTENIGAVDNFNFTLRQSSGIYFFWHAQDDIRATTYVEKCVAKFQKQPELIFCHSIYIEFLNSPAEHHALKSLQSIARQSVSDRFIDAYKTRIGSTAFYGMYDLNRVRSKLLWQNYTGSDIAIFQAILLEGQIAEVPEVLFYYRRKRNVRDKREHYKFLRKTNKVRLVYWPSIILLINILNVIIQSSITKTEKTYLAARVLLSEGFTIAVTLNYVLIKKVFGQTAGHYFLRLLRRTDIQPMNVGHKD